MSIHNPDLPEFRSLELPVEEVIRQARPLPPYEETVIEDLTDDEQAVFWAAISE